MQFLLDYAEQRVRPLAEAALSFSSVQGIVLEPDPLWLYWLALTDYAGRTRARYLSPLRLWPIFRGIPFESDVRFRRRLSQLFMGPRDLAPSRQLTLEDLQELPDTWEEYSEQAGWPKEARDPIVVKVRLFPNISPEDRVRLSDLPMINTLRVVFETHPPAVFYSGPRARSVPLVGGVSIGVGTVHDGTLGGILRDGSKFYGLTCSHVVPNDRDIVEQPARRDSSPSATRIGQRVTGTKLVSSKPSDPCNAYTTTTPVNSLDVALVEIDSRINVVSPLEVRGIGAVTAIIPRHLLNSGQQAEFSGKQSGHKSRLLAGVGVPYRVANRATGNVHCFQHLLVFRSSNNRAPSKQGDSGAWLCMQYGSGYGWAGMIIGGDGPDGYAIFADGIEEWWKTQGFSLTL